MWISEACLFVEALLYASKIEKHQRRQNLCYVNKVIPVFPAARKSV